MIEKNQFTFIDLFAGIGGFHIAMHNLGGKCVFASEMDKHARQTYKQNFEKISPELFRNNMFNEDIRKMNISEIPDFDVLCAGFPCQPFSQAGHKRGFNDNHNSERGNLFFNIAEILEVKKPKAFFLENVRGLVKHDNGNTFNVIRSILETELNYSFYYKIVKASDYGLPQLRPRVFILGFRDEKFLKGFNFPDKIPLKYNMSDVWGGDCSREIGYTLRVGGRGSDINDRRNWDSYLVDNEVKRLGVKEGKKMQGFPEDFEFPVSDTQAIKQLGNSVAIDAVQAVAKQMITHMNNLNLNEKQVIETKNKGEWTELLVFMRLLTEQKLFLSDYKLNRKADFFKIKKVTTRNLDLDFLIIDNHNILSIDNITKEKKYIDISKILNNKSLKTIQDKIAGGKKTFIIDEFRVIQNTLGFHVIKGGTSYQKSDILLDVEKDDIVMSNEGFGIKSYLGSKPTLLNASGNTNFIFRVDGFDPNKIDLVNNIKTRTKLKDRINKIEKLGGKFEYIGPEKDSMTHNLKIVDSLMPEIVGHLLLTYYSKRISKLNKIIDYIHLNQHLNREINYGDKQVLEIKIKKLLVDILLGFFAGTKWNGDYLANGTIIMKKSGEMVGFHIIDSKSLKDYLYENIKLETPSTTRHRYGHLYIEKDGKVYFKLNLQLRF